MGYYNNYDGNGYGGRGGLFGNLPVATKNLLTINIFVFIFYLLRQEFMTEHFALFYPTSPFFHWWQFITYMFMHGGWLHIFMNMFALVMFGASLESMWGPKKFLIYYFTTGLGAAFLHTGVQWMQIHYGLASPQLVQMIPTVGASGAIYGLLIGYAMLFPDSRLTLIFPPISLTAKWWVIIWVVMEVLLGVTGRDGVAHFAHLGGMLFGWLLIRYWKKQGKMYDYEQ